MKPWTIVACAGLALSVTTAPLASAGDLAPPEGAIASSMKPLSAVEPRVCVSELPSSQTASVHITQPGSYVFTADLTGENGKDGIHIDGDAFPLGDHTVVLCMQGFSLKGVQGAANAILVTNSDPQNRRLHLTISGTARDASGNLSLISGWAVDGVHVEGATSCVVEGLRVTDCQGDGIECRGAGAEPRVRVRSASVSLCAGDGIHMEECLGVELADVRVSDCVGDGFESYRVAAPTERKKCFTSHFKCDFVSNGGDGVVVSLPADDASSLDIQEVRCLSNSGHGVRIIYASSGGTGVGKSHIRVASTDASENSLDGFRLDIGDESISADFDDLHTARNGGHGTRLSVDRSASRTMSADFRRCSSSGNVGDGFSCVIVNDSINSGNNINWDFCDASGNTGHGFYASTVPPLVPHQGRLLHCRASRNGGDGGRFESADESIDLCEFSDNGGSGITVLDAENVSISNSSCVGNGTGPTGGDGFSLPSPGHTTLTRLTATENADNGISISDLDRDGNLDFVTCSGNGASGIHISNGGDLRISDSSCVGNGTGPVGGDGVSLPSPGLTTLTRLHATDNTGNGVSSSDCPRLRVQSCDLSSNDLDGLRCVGGSTLEVRGGSFSSNTGSGLYCTALSVSSSVSSLRTCDNAGHGEWWPDCDSDDLYLDRCISSGNGGSGIFVDNTLGLPCGRATFERCVTNGNIGSGIDVSCSVGGSVRGCESSSNGQWGFLIAGNNHVVVENTASSNVSGSFLVSTPGNTLGPLVDEAGVATNTNPAANYVR